MANKNTICLVVGCLCLAQLAMVVVAKNKCHNNNNNSADKKVHYRVETVETFYSDLGEGPHWDEKQQVLWHTDINTFRVCRLNVTSRVADCHQLQDIATLVHPYPDGQNLLVTQRNKMVRLNWQTKHVDVLGEVAPELKGKERFNDGKADQTGRLWMGTILDSDKGVVPGKGNLYKWENGKFVKAADGFYLTNGMTWSYDNRKMFINDSEGRKIYVFDFDIEKGTLSNKRVLIDGDNSTDITVNDHPDGLTRDKQGYLWSASYAGGRVFRVDPQTGDVIDSIAIPCPLVTTPVFGGPNFDQMLITTAYKNFGPDQRTQHPTCGQTHRITAINSKDFVGTVDYRPKL
ncbi:regucalcin-like [Oppia nitens]|uniref:regucalcin-like n=1 Tax=Oppia nitens TaxID=1686743 RepID=UPI0023DB946B|nr:regucalcin-like [Oppia nitens]